MTLLPPSMPAPLAPSPLDLLRGRCNVSIVTGSYGAGHDAAARELVKHLGEPGCAVSSWRVTLTATDQLLRKQPALFGPLGEHWE